MIIVFVVLVLAGCGAPAGTRSVPITEVEQAGPDERDQPATRAPRAIATH